MKLLRNACMALAALAGVIQANAQVTVFQADFQASTVEAYTDADNLDSGTAIGSWLFQMDTNINVFGNAGASQKALCPDSNGDGGYGLTAFFTTSVKLESNVVVTLKLARGRNGASGNGKTFTMTGYDTLGNPSFDLQVFANQNQAAGTNGAIYWNNGFNYTNNFGSTYSLAGDVRQINISSTGYNPGNMTALQVQLQAGGYVVSLDKDNNGGFEWTSSLLPYNGSPATISRISFTGGTGSGNWFDDIQVTGVPTTAPVNLVSNGYVAIQPERQAQLITGWGYDIKAGGKAAGLTPTFAQTLFINDRMNILRLPVWGDASHPAHPSSGVVVGSYYADILYAMTNAWAANSKIILFASKKLDGTNSFPAWIKDANGVVPASYAELLADFLQYMETNGFVFDVLGIDNEETYNEGNITPARYKDTIDALRSLAITRGFTMPKRLIAPEDYGPNDGWMSTLVSSGWGDRCDIVGTHYYPQWRPLTKLQNLVVAGGSRPAWHSEVHWDNNTSDVIEQAEEALATIFDCTDTGLSGFTWWGYTRSGIKGGLEQAISSSTAQTRPVVTTDTDGSARTLGKLITRAFRDNTNIVIWALNNTTNQYADCQFRCDRGQYVGPAQYTQWDVVGSTFGSVTMAGLTNFNLTIAARSMLMVKVGYLPPGPDAQYAFEGSVLDTSSNANHGIANFSATNYAFGRIGASALQFNGTDSTVQIPRTVGADTNFTVTFWMKTTGPSGTGSQWYNGKGLVDGEVSGSTGDFGVTLLNGKIAFGIGSPDTTLQSAATVTNGQWRHVAVTRNGFDGEMAIYLDGVLDANLFGPTGPKTAPPVLRLGSLQTSNQTAKYFSGTLDEVRLYNRLLAVSEISALAAAPLPNTAPVLVGLSNQMLVAGQTLNLTNSATDPEVPPQVLTWQLQPTVAGVTFNTNSGIMNWRPTIAQSPGTSVFNLIVTDNGSPSLSATQQFQVTVLRPAAPLISSPSVTGGNFTLTINGDAGPDYRLQSSTNLAQWTTQLVTNPVALPVTVTISASNNLPRQFFRLELGP